MAETVKVLFGPAQIPNVQTPLYIAPAGTRAVIEKCTGVNSGTSVAVVTVNLVPSGGSVSNANAVTYLKGIGPSPAPAYQFSELIGQVLNSGDSISAISSIGAAVSIRISGREIT
jgi:hypothetical protein